MPTKKKKITPKKTTRKTVVKEETIESAQWLTKEVRPLVAGYILQAPLEKMPIEHTVQAWAMLDFIEKKISARKAELRLQLMAVAEQAGKKTDKGGYRLYIAGTTVLNERRESKAPDEEQLQEILESQDIPLGAVYDEVKILQLNPSKLQALVDAGQIDAADIQETKKVSWALKVHPGEALQQVLDDAEKKFEQSTLKKLKDADD